MATNAAARSCELSLPETLYRLWYAAVGEGARAGGEAGTVHRWAQPSRAATERLEHALGIRPTDRRVSSACVRFHFCSSRLSALAASLGLFTARGHAF